MTFKVIQPLQAFSNIRATFYQISTYSVLSRSLSDSWASCLTEASCEVATSAHITLFCTLQGNSKLLLFENRGISYSTCTVSPSLSKFDFRLCVKLNR